MWVYGANSGVRYRDQGRYTTRAWFLNARKRNHLTRITNTRDNTWSITLPCCKTDGLLGILVKSWQQTAQILNLVMILHFRKYICLEIHYTFQKISRFDDSHIVLKIVPRFNTIVPKLIQSRDDMVSIFLQRRNFISTTSF